jgi:lactoylglutathione lyase
MLNFLRKLRRIKMNKVTLYFLAISLICISACDSERADTKVSPRFNHVFLAVADLDRSIDFYTKAFELEVTKRLKQLKRTGSDGVVTEIEVNLAFLKFPGQDFVLEIGERDGFVSVNTTANYAHVGIDVKDIISAFDKLVKAGATQIQPITLVEADGVSAKNAFFTGPDGETIELMEMISGEF